MLRFKETDLVGRYSKKGNQNDRRDRNYNNRRDGRTDRKDDQNQNRRENNGSIKNAKRHERSFGDEDEQQMSTMKKTVSDEVIRADDVLSMFLRDYADVITEHGNRVPIVIRDSFWDVARILTHYYEPKYNSVVDKMNKVFDVIKTQRFANSLSIVVNEDGSDDWWCDSIARDVSFIVSTVLATCHTSMRDEAIEEYVDLLASRKLCGKDINRLVTNIGITKDLAVDLMASIPVVPDDMTDILLKQFYNSFIMRLMDHADDNIDVMDRGTQGRLFNFFFGKEGNVALKAVGRMLGHMKISGFKSESQRLIYAEYLHMLSEKLNSFEIRDIKYVLKFIVTEKKRQGRDAMLLFGDVSFAEYDSIRKALFELISDDKEAKEMLM